MARRGVGVKEYAKALSRQKNRERFSYISPLSKRRRKSTLKVCPVCCDSFLGFTTQKYCGRSCAARSRWLLIKDD